MKKYLALILALVMALSLAACGGNSGSSAKTDSKSDSAELPTLRVAAMPFITSLPTYYIQQNNLGDHVCHRRTHERGSGRRSVGRGRYGRRSRHRRCQL